MNCGPGDTVIRFLTWSHQRGPVTNFRDGLEGKSTSCSSGASCMGNPDRPKFAAHEDFWEKMKQASSTNTVGHLQHSCTEQSAQPAPLESTGNKIEQAINYSVLHKNVMICWTFSCPKQLERQLLIVKEFRLPLQSSTLAATSLTYYYIAPKVVHRALLCI